MYKNKHLGTQTISINIFKRMSESQKSSEFHREAGIESNLGYKPVLESYSLLIPKHSAVSGIITNWSRMEKTETQPQRGRPLKVT